MQALLKDIRKTSALTDPDVANHQGARKTEYIRVVAVRGGKYRRKQPRLRGYDDVHCNAVLPVRLRMTVSLMTAMVRRQSKLYARGEWSFCRDPN